MHNATYKNPAIGTVCHALHKGTLNNCHDIVFGHLKCTKTNIMATITFITFSHSNNHNVCHKLNNYFTLNNTNPFINHMSFYTQHEESRIYRIYDFILSNTILDQLSRGVAMAIISQQTNL